MLTPAAAQRRARPDRPAARPGADAARSSTTASTWSRRSPTWSPTWSRPPGTCGCSPRPARRWRSPRERVYPLAQLGIDDAVELFRERATAARPGVRLDEDDVRARRAPPRRPAARDRARRRQGAGDVGRGDRPPARRPVRAAARRRPQRARRGTRRCSRSSTGRGTCSASGSAARCAGCRPSRTASPSRRRRRCSAPTRSTPSRSSWRPVPAHRASRRPTASATACSRRCASSAACGWSAAGEDRRGAGRRTGLGRRATPAGTAPGCTRRSRPTRWTGCARRRPTSPTCLREALDDPDPEAVVVLFSALARLLVHRAGTTCAASPSPAPSPPRWPAGRRRPGSSTGPGWRSASPCSTRSSLPPTTPARWPRLLSGLGAARRTPTSGP